MVTLSRVLPSPRTRTAGAFTALTLTLATLAILHDGTEVADVDLNDGGVWVTNENLNGYMVAAHLNYPSRQLDANTKTIAGAGFDLSQEANSVVVDTDARQLSAVTTSTWELDATPAQLAEGLEASQGTDVVAIADPNLGKVWALPAREVATFDAETTPPVLEGATGVRVVVGKDDTIHTVEAEGTLRDITASGSTWTAEEVGSTPELREDDLQAVQLAAVGARGVVFNPEAGWVAWPGESTDLDDAKGLVLQQSGADLGWVGLAGPSGLVQVPIDGGDPEVLSAPPGGGPIAPVTVGECGYAAWVGTGAYLRDCEDDADDREVKTFPHLTSNEELVFRTNRDVVVLNDPSNGDIFLVNEDMQEISDWDTVLANLKQDQEDEKDKTIAVTERSEQNTPPDPRDDEFGVRPGASVTLPVLANDRDADGDVLTARLAAEEVDGIGQVELVRDGRAVRITVDGDAAPGTTKSFTYTADDGRKNGRKDAKVALEVHGDATNDAVELTVPDRQSKLTIRSGGQGEHHILQEWKDPDGDPFWVSRVEYGEGLSGTYRPNGLIQVRDDGREGLPRDRKVRVTMTDGRTSGSRTVDLTVTVLAPDNKAKPLANADYVTTLVSDRSGDHTALARPLRNDVDPNGDELFPQLVGRMPEGLSVQQSQDFGLTVSSTKVGTEYVEYSVTDGTSTVKSVLRVDTVTPEQAKPVPDNDLAVLPPHGEAQVDVLSNDTDPLGGVLVLESVDTAGATGVIAEVVDHEYLRIKDNGLRPGQPVTIAYQVGNGTLHGTGRVTVVVDPDRKAAEPVANDDEGTVRSGDVVTVDVLDNDLSPTNLPLEVLPLAEDAVTLGADLGEAWVSENKLRFKATGEQGLVRVRYSISDGKRRQTAAVQVNVTPSSGSNAAPQPEALTGRVVQASASAPGDREGTVEISVPLVGIDPDGDSVELIGLDIKNPPRKGSVAFDGDTITYLPATGEANLGTDTFGYVVEDRYGKQGIGEVQVGISEPPSNNLEPQPQDDFRVVRPDRRLAIPVTANDIDPEGAALTLKSAIEQTGGPDAKAEVVDGRVVLTTPDEPGTISYRYTVRDDLGSEASASIEVEVDEDAPALAPVARDDRVPVAEVIGKSEVTVDVLRNDEDPDGAVSELEPEVDAAGVDVVDGNQLVIPVTPERQVIVYRLTDPDDQVGRAVVVVPGSESDAAQRPALRPDAELPIEVDAGASVEIDLADYVVVREGRSPSLPFSENLRPGPGHDGSKLKTGEDVITFGADEEFYGPTSVVATVSDTRGDDDVDALASTLALPLFVNAAGQTQPSLRVPEIVVAPAEPWEAELDLLASDPDPGDQERLRFDKDKVDGDLVVEIDDDVLRVEAAGGTEPGGPPISFDLVVEDGTTAPVTRRVWVEVVDSTRPLISVRDAELTIDAGTSETVDLEDFVTFNPYEEDGDPVELVGEPRLVSGDATLETSGLDVTITPAEDFHGTAVLTYLLRDATELAERQVQGQVLLNVRGAPSPPTTVTAEAGNGQVELGWSGAEPNGAEITSYLVKWTGEGGSGEQRVGAEPSATITGLNNGKSYRFQVIATNEVADSQPSEWSADVTPDWVPNPPPGLAVEFDDDALHVSWSKPVYEGTPVKRYDVRVNGKVVDAGTALSKSLTAEHGITNGTEYKIQVRAVNDAEAAPYDNTPGASAWSATVVQTPNGVPEVTSTQIVGDPPTDDDPSAKISWAAEDNGWPVSKFEVRRAGGAVVACAAEGASACRVRLPEGRQQTFQVRLFNRSGPFSEGWGPWSAATDPISGATPPEPVRDLGARATGRSGQATVTFTYGPAEMNGADRVEFYSNAWSGARDGSGPDGGGNHSVAVSGLSNGQVTSIQVWAVTYANEGSGGGASAAGPSAPPADVRAFAPCTGEARSTASGYEKVDFEYRITANGRPCRWSGDVDGGPWNGNGSNLGTSSWTPYSEAGGQGSTVHFNFSVTTTANQPGDPSPVPDTPVPVHASGSTWGASGYEVRHDGPKSPCDFSNCTYVSVRLFDWAPNRTVYCWTGGVGAPDWWAYIGVNEGGDSGWVNNGPNGRLFDSAGSRFKDGTNTGEISCRLN